MIKVRGWIICLSFFAVLMIAGAPARAVPVEGIIDLQLHDQQITLVADQADMSSVLHAIADKSGIKLWISAKLPTHRITTRVEHEPLPKFLAQLLRSQSYALVYDEAKDKVTGLYVLPPGDTLPAQIELMPGNNRDDTSALQEALESIEIPDNVKMALVDQFNAVTTQAADLIDTTQLDAIMQLVEAIGQEATADPTTFRRLWQEPGQQGSQQ